MRINKRLIKHNYGRAYLNIHFRRLGEAIQRELIDPINRAFIKAIEEGRIQLFENEDGTITSPVIYVDFKEKVMTWENTKPE